MSSHSSIVYEWSTDTEHTCCRPGLSVRLFSLPLLPPSFFPSLSTEEKNPPFLFFFSFTFVICTCLLSLQRGHTCGEESCACSGWKRGKKAELCFVLKWVVEKPACPLGAERGGACGVWDSRQRRHIHTDTGSLERKERQTAGELHFFSYTGGDPSNSWTTFFLVCVFWKTFSFVRRGQLYGFICELRDVCVGAGVAICCL